jgi:hypothetical protein
MLKRIVVSICLSLLFGNLVAQTTFIGGGGDNNWNTPGNWSAGIPGPTDDVTIADGVTVDVNVDGQCASLTFADNATTTTININAAITLTVSGDVNFGNPSVDGANQYLNVDDGNLIADNIYWVNTGSNAQDAQLWLSDGNVTVSGDILGAEDAGQRNRVDCSPGGVNGTGTITVGDRFYSTDNGGGFFDRGLSTIVFNGTVDQTIFNFNYHHVTVQNTGTKSLRASTNIYGDLTIDAVLNLDGNYARVFTNRTIQTTTAFGPSAMIDLQNGGYLWFEGNDATDYQIEYPIGYGSNYNPLIITSIAGTDLNGDLYLRLYDTKHPLTSGTDNALTKYWDITSAGLTITSTTGSLTYSDEDAQAPITETNLITRGRLGSGGWLTDEVGTNYNHTTNQITFTAISNFEGQWTLGENSGCFDGTLPDKYTIANGNWNTASIWNGGTVPVAGDNVTILHAVTLNTAPTVGNLEVLSIGNLYLNNQNITVQGTTDIYGILRDVNGTNGLTRTFQDKITVYNGGSFTCTVDQRTYTFEGGIENNGTFEITNGNGMTINFNTASQIISGSESPIIDGTITIASGLTLTNQVSEATNGLIIEGTVNGADGTASLVNETILSFQGNAVSFGTAGVFDANSTAGNTVKYNSSANGTQYIIPGTYENVELQDGNGANNSDKYLSGDVTVNGDFTIEIETDFYPVSYNLTVAGTATIKDRIYDTNIAGTCTFNGDAVIDGARFDGSQNGNIVFDGTLTALTSGFTVDRCNFTLNPSLTIPSGVIVSIIDGNGTKTFNDVTVENGGDWSNTGNSAITISGDLTVNTGATFSQGTGIYTFDGTSKSIGGTISDIDFQAMNIDGTITNNIADIDVVGSITINSGSFTNNGDISFGNDINVDAGSYTNNSITSVVDDLSGAGTFTQGANSTLFIGGDASVTTFDASVNPNTVDYNGDADQNVNGGTYHHLIVRDGNTNNSSHTLLGNVLVNGDFTVATSTYFDPMTFDFTVTGSSTITGVFDDDNVVGTSNLQDVDLSGGAINGGATGIVNILGDLTMPTGDAIIGRADISITGTTTVPIGNTLTFNNANGTKTFLGDVLLNGNWTNSGNESFTCSGDFTVNNTSTFTQGNGTYTFDGTAKELNGTTVGIDLQTLVIDGTITNNISDIDVLTDITINSGSFTNEGDISIVDDIIVTAGTFTNNNTVYAGDDIDGAGTYTQGDNSYLTIVDDAVLTTFNSSANGNTVEYYSTGGTDIRGNTYHHLIISQVGGATRYLDNAESTITVNGDLTVSDDAILIYQRYTAQTLNVLGDLSGTGTIYFDVRNSVHNLNLSGANNAIGGFTVNGGNDFTIDYNGADQQVISANNYDILTISGSGTKTMQGDVTANDAVNVNAGTLDLNSNNLTTSGAIDIASGATLEVDENAQLLIADGQTLTNSGTLSVVGTSGNEAIVTINGIGNYYITQPAAGAEISAQYYQFNYLNDGIVISDGSINAINNFSNGSFSNGIGSQYINTTGIDVSGIGNISNVVFNAGPTYNASRTSGTGTMTFADATGALSGENFDNDNGNPGTLIDWSYPGSTYYSQGNLPAGLTSSWNTDPGGSGSNPASVTDGLATLIVQDGHTITLDNNGDIDVLALQVGEGTSGIFRIGEDGTQRTLTIRETLDVQAGALLNVVSSGAPSHEIIIYGNITNDGTINLRTTSSNVANTEFYGVSTLVSGTTAPIFNDVTFKSGSNVTASVSLDIDNNIILEDNSVFQDGGISHYIANNWTADGTASMTGNGTIVFDGLVNTIENGTAASFTFYNLIFNGGTAGSIQEDIIVTNSFEIDNSTTVSIADYSVNIAGDFTVNSGSTYSQSDNTTTFDGTTAQTLDFSGDVTFYNLTFSNGGANAKSISGNITANNRVTIDAGSTVDGAGTHTIDGGLRIDGTCNFSGIVNLTGNYLLTYSATNALTLGTAILNIEGNVTLTYAGAATALQANVFNNVNVNNGILALNDNTSLVGQAGDNFNLNFGTILYVRGADNFPSGFGTYNLDFGSRVDYEGGFDQTVRGNITYGTLRLEIAGTKTVDGPLDVDNQLQLYDNTTLDLQNFDHTFASNITNEAGGCTISGASSNVTLDADNSNQIVQTGIYSFNDLIITLSAGTDDRTKSFYSGSTISINGDFLISNALGSPSVFLTIDFNDNGIGGTPNDFNLGSYCQFNTSNTTFDVSAMNNFGGTITLDPTTIFYYELNGAQNIAGGFTYGNLTFNGGDKTATSALDIDGDISQTANNPVFYDGGFTHTVQGDWLLNSTLWYTQASATGTIEFDGVDHDIRGYNFNNIIFNNTGIATSLNNLIVYGDFTVENGATFEAGTRNIDISGNWLVNPTGLFTQEDDGVTTFNGPTNQNLTSNANSYFGDLTIDKPNAVGNQTVTVLSELHVNDYFRIKTDAGVLDISNQDAYFSGYFYIYNNTVEAGSPFIATNSTDGFMRCGPKATGSSFRTSTGLSARHAYSIENRTGTLLSKAVRSWHFHHLGSSGLF